MSDENRIRLIASQPIRGRILDRNGNVLADSRVKYSLIIKPQSVNDINWEKHKLIVSDLLNVDSNLIEKKYFDGLKNKQLSVTILDDLDEGQIIKFKENEDNLSSFEIATKLIRNYPYKSLAAHVIGYTQPITDPEYKFLSKKGYKLNDLIGRTGIEYVYEDFIRGEWGGEMVEVNSLGEFQKSLGTKPSKQGNDIQLTIDINLQLVAEKVLKNKKAEIVTDEIIEFNEFGIRLKSGRQLDSDIIITATGLNLQIMGGASIKIDSEEVDLSKCWTYKGIMISDIPNMVSTFGYINASWTLRADLISEWVCKLLNFMDQERSKSVTPIASDTVSYTHLTLPTTVIV